jgi:CubicO group peptidase (beta-lactamase class C family)
VVPETRDQLNEMKDAHVPAANQFSFSPERLEAIRERFDPDVAAMKIPGATIVIGNREKLIFEYNGGCRDTTTRDSLKPDAIWRIYSMTKPVVTTSAMMLVERGLLRLDQPVAEFIPSFANLRVMHADGTEVPARQAPTIQDLMRHSAGLAYGYFGDSPAQRAYVADGFLAEDLLNADFVDRLAALPLECEPGTVWHYSHATDVLGRILEVISGHSLQHVLEDTLFGPLGMTDSCFHLPLVKRDRVAQPLPQANTARPRFFDPCAPRRGQRGGGGLVSTASDYGRFLRMLLRGGTLDGQRILSPATVAYMTADHLGHDIGRSNYYPPGPGYGFGLGFAVRVAAGEAPFPGSQGDYFWSGVGGTYFWVDPALNFFAILMLQTSSLGQRLHYRTLMRNMVYAALDV